MAKKMDDELLDDLRTENKKFHQNGQSGKVENNGGPEVKNENTNTENNATGEGEKKEAEKGPELNNASTNQNQFNNNPQPDPQSEEFKKKFDEYFKGAGSIIAGKTIVELIDDFKTKLLYIYAKKNKVDIPMEALKMDPKGKEFAAFLVDYAIKNKLFGWIEKYPLIAAGGVMAISGVSTVLVIEMMKKGNKENEDLKAEIEKLKKERQEKNRAEATDANIVNETINKM